MNYERCIASIKKIPVPPVPERLWHRIEQTLQEKEQYRLHWNVFSIMPTTVLAGAVMVFALTLWLNVIHNGQVTAYVQMTESTEYIYEQCKYPG